MQATINDGLPLLLCTECSQLINQSYVFKQQCIRSDEILRQYISELKSQEVELQLSEYLKTEMVDFIKAEKEDASQKQSTEFINNDNSDNLDISDNELIVHKQTKSTKSATTKKLKNGENNFAFTCKVCGEGFELIEDLDIHMICHPTDDKIVCTMCQKEFADVKVLKRHVRIHMKNKPFNCEVCNKGFAESGSLTRHLRKHRGEKRHLCTVCGKGFYEANVLSVHMRTHTGN